jgi:hypothetical protein
MTVSKGIGRGGRRPGAGRKPGSRIEQAFEHEPCCAALVNALDGKPAFLFIEAMRVLEAPLDDAREALGLSRDQFMQEYGTFLSACAELRKRGEDAFFADETAVARLQNTAAR